jgi:predicted DNA binding CopG/RHH family protein
MPKKLKKLPNFRSELKEREFWAKHSSTDYIDWSKSKLSIFPSLRPSSRTISIRLPEALLESIKLLANRRDVPYQSLLKMLLAEKIQEAFELTKRKGQAA